MLTALLFPQIDPVLVHLGPISIRWYALAYIVGIILGWRLALRLADRPPRLVSRQSVDDFVFAATLGIVFGGRLGYVLFYKPSYYLAHPLEILQVWQGGMSFHGGMLGVIVAMIIHARINRAPLFALADVVAIVTPIGLFFGRIANFINGELWGRITTVPWGMIFPNGGPDPRHPSQLYQAGLEGIVLFAVMMLIERSGARRHPGVAAGGFLAGYGVLRSIGELFREPDAFLGFVVGGITMGQVLCVPMVLVGLVLIVAGRRGRLAGDAKAARVAA